jgi:hypothetical protein
MAVLCILITFIISTPDIHFKKGHSNLNLTSDADLHLAIGPGWSAFLIASLLFFKNAVIRISESVSTKDFPGTTITTSAVAISGNSADIFFKASPTAVNIDLWIVNSSKCQRALFIRGHEGYQLRMASGSSVCVFPVGTPTGPVDHSPAVEFHTEAGGQARSPDKQCLWNGGVPYYATFPASSEEIFLAEYSIGRKSVCEMGFFTFLAVEASGKGPSSLPNPWLSCLPENTSLWHTGAFWMTAVLGIAGIFTGIKFRRSRQPEEKRGTYQMRS